MSNKEHNTVNDKEYDNATAAAGEPVDGQACGCEVEDADTVVADVADVDGDTDVPGETEALKDQLEKERGRVEAMKKDYMFLMAEFDNFKKRTLKEKSELLKNAAEGTLKGLLPIVDDFERGLAAAATSNDASAVKEGMELIYNKLVKYLQANGVKAIESTGAVFDPEEHEAIAMVPVPDEESKGKVIDTLTKGYKLNDKVLRHAKVAVGQ